MDPISIELMIEAFAETAPEFFAPEAFAATEAVGAGATAMGTGAAANYLGNMAAVNALENPAVAQGIMNAGVTGGAGAGASGVNEELIRSQLAKSAEVANSGIDKIPQLPQNFSSGVTDIVQNAGPGTQVAGPSDEIIRNMANGDVRTTLPTQAPNPFAQQLANPSLASDMTQQMGDFVPPPAAESSSILDALKNGYTSAEKWMEGNKWKTAGLAYMGANKLGLLNPNQRTFNAEPYSGPLSKYRLSPDFQTSTPQSNIYKPTYAAAGGIMQAGGPVEQMSMNAVGGNMDYPGAQLPQHSGYASPVANPIPQNVVQGDAGDVGVNPQTGQERFASGGIARYDIGGEIGKAFGGASNLISNLTEGHISLSGPEAMAAAKAQDGRYRNDYSSPAVTPNRYTPQYASGGIAHFSKGNLADAMDFYKSMTTSQAKAPSFKEDPGIYYDQDPDTRYQDALTAAQIRQAKVNKRANVSPPVAKRPTPMGQLNLRPPGAQAAAASSTLDPENAAQGGIMHSSLGGYAAGGNPRLLKGPGDGMSDNIPATIANKQPARLADGEFVIPADVVSHLGNGSTDAGAKRLHEMMNKIRKARTGNPKQGKQINPNKFMPA